MARSTTIREGYEVSWVSNIPLNEYGDREYDQETGHVARFESPDEALSYAKKVFPQTKGFYNLVEITPFKIVECEDAPDLFDYEYGESEFYEGES